MGNSFISEINSLFLLKRNTLQKTLNKSSLNIMDMFSDFKRNNV